MSLSRKLWAKQRNWLLFRLRGAISTFSYYNEQLMRSLLPIEKHYMIYKVGADLRDLYVEISKSEWKEKN